MRQKKKERHVVDSLADIPTRGIPVECQMVREKWRGRVKVDCGVNVEKVQFTKKRVVKACDKTMDRGTLKKHIKSYVHEKTVNYSCDKCDF